MYKVLTLNYLLNGRVYNENRVYPFDNENFGTIIKIVVPEDYEDFTFVMDCRNGTVTKQLELGFGETIYFLDLDDSLTLAGSLELQLWATTLNSQQETVKVQWEKYILTINDALNISEITAESNPDLIATHTSQIADLYNLTSILDAGGDGTKYLADDGTYKFVSETMDYNDLDDKPQINSVELIGNKSLEDLGIQPEGDYLTEEVDPTVPSWAKESTKPDYDYSEIGNTPTQISTFENDIGYLTTETDPTVPAWAKATNKPSYSYSEISNTPTKLSEFTNDPGYITGYVETDPTVPSWAKNSVKPSYDYSEIGNPPTIPTKVSELTNDSGYITTYVETDPTVPSWAKAVSKPSYTFDELSDVTITTPASNDIAYYTGSIWANKTFDVAKTFAGFVNRTDSTITVNGSGVVTLAPAVTSFTVYTMGIKHVLTNTQTVSVTQDQTITYIYLDSSGVLQKSLSAWDLTSGLNIPVGICFKDGSTYALTDERHGHERNKAWHNWAHNNIGAMYKSGLTGTFTTSTLSITQGIIYDEDLQADTGSTHTTCSLWYRNATTGMRLVRGSSYAKAVSIGGILQYDDGTGTLHDVTNNRYATNWVYATNDPTEPIYCVIGQGDYTNLTNARNASAPTINLSTAEWKLIYRVIYQRTTGVPAGTFIESADFRTVQTGVPTSASTTDHNALINRDTVNSHPSSAVSYDNGGDVLTNVQSELDARINKTYVITIATGDWSTNTYTQTITGLTNADFVDIWASTDTDEGYIDSWGITWTQSGDTITFTKTGSATTTLSLNMAIIKCSDGGTL